MADSGSPLGDLLAGAAGAPVNRPALNNFVAGGQALAGLRTAQTEDALVRAQQTREEMDAGDQLEAGLTSAGMQPSAARSAALMMKAHFGNSQQALEAMKLMQEIGFRGTLGDPSKMNTPEQTAASQGVTGKLEPFTSVPQAYVQNPGAHPAPVQTSPVANAKMGLEDSQALLARMKADHPEAFKNGQLDPEMLPLLIQYVRENPGAAPSGRALTTPTGSAIAAGLVANPPGGAAPAAGAQPGTAPGAAPGAQPSPDHTPAAQVPGAAIHPAPGVSLAEQAAIRKDFASGKASNQMSALNTMVLHSLLFDKLADQMGNGNFTPTNDINVLWQRLFGSAAPGNLKIASEFLGREAVRATVNAGAGTGEERELKVGMASSPEAFHGAADTLRSLAGGQLRSLIRRGNRGGVDATQLLDPEAIQAYGLGHSTQPGLTPVGGGAGTGPPAGGLAAFERH